MNIDNTLLIVMALIFQILLIFMILRLTGTRMSLEVEFSRQPENKPSDDSEKNEDLGDS